MPAEGQRPLADGGPALGPSPSTDEYVGRSPDGNVGRGSKPACAGLDGRSASRVSRLARAGLVS